MATINIAFFVSSHGFGHAARSAAVIHALCARRRDVAVHLVTDVPEWFFDGYPISRYHPPPAVLDVGMIQTDPLTVDVTATVKALNGCFPYSPELIHRLADMLSPFHCQAIVSDIAPAGILVAKHLGIPGILLENFTWDWIYNAYTQQNPAFAPIIQYLAGVYAKADYRIKATPFCQTGSADLVVPPVSRPYRMVPSEVRRALKISPDETGIMVTLGGIPVDHRHMIPESLPPGKVVVFSGIRTMPDRCPDQVRLLPHQSPIPHPDLVASLDGVIGKVGYSTIAEVYAAGVPFGYLRRQNFRESPALEKFIDSSMASVAMDNKMLTSETIGHGVEKVCRLPRRNGPVPNGADVIAQFLDETILPVNADSPTRLSRITP